jgi:hypothetical protein
MLLDEWSVSIRSYFEKQEYVPLPFLLFIPSAILLAFFSYTFVYRSICQEEMEKTTNAISPSFETDPISRIRSSAANQYTVTFIVGKSVKKELDAKKQRANLK